jgi:hypothetical protein
MFIIPLTWSFPIKINPHKTFIYITVNILQYSIIWEIVFPQYFNKKLFLFVDLYLSLDKLARKLYLSGKFYVQVAVVFRKQLKITRIVQVLSWVLRPDCNDNCTAFT